MARFFKKEGRERCRAALLCAALLLCAAAAAPPFCALQPRATFHKAVPLPSVSAAASSSAASSSAASSSAASSSAAASSAASSSAASSSAAASSAASSAAASSAAASSAASSASEATQGTAENRSPENDGHYTITFCPAGASGEAFTCLSQTEEGKEYLYFPDNPFAAEGRTFAGWCADPDGTGEVWNRTLRLACKADAVYYAVWLSANAPAPQTPAQYRVHLDGTLRRQPAAEGSDTVTAALDGTLREPKAVRNDEAAVLAALGTPPDAVRLNAALQDKGYERTFDPATQEIVWYAVTKENGVWMVDGALRSKTAYHVRYELNATEDAQALFAAGGTLSQCASRDDSVRVCLTPAPTRPGYTFLGWAETPDATEPLYTRGGADSFSMPDADVTLYAVWQARAYTVRWTNTNGAVLTQTQAAYGETPVGPAETPVKADTASASYSFTGWRAAGTGAEPGPVTGSIVYIAQFAASPLFPVRCTVDGEPVSGGSAGKSLASGATLTPPEAPVRTGYEFTGWTATDLTARTQLLPNADGSYTMPAHEVLLSGAFTPAADTAYTVLHSVQDAEGDGWTLADTDALTGRTGGTPRPFTHSYAGCAPDVSRTTWEQTGVAASKEPLLIAADDSLVLHYYYARRKHTVSYALSGEAEPRAETPAAARVRVGASVALAAPPEPVKGYTFTGWQTPDGVTAVNGAFSMPDRDVTLTGVWTLARYTLAYELNGGVNAAQNPVSYTVETPAASLRFAAPTRAGYTFDGWTSSLSASGSSARATALLPEAACNVTLTAHWKANTHPVVYTLTGEAPAGCALPQNSEAAVGDALRVQGALAAEGYVFSGWSTEDAAVTNGAFSMPDKSVAFTGSFQRAGSAAFRVEYLLAQTGESYAEAQDTRLESSCAPGRTPEIPRKRFAGFVLEKITWQTAASPESARACAVDADGSLVVRVYYARRSYSLTYVFAGDVPRVAAAPEPCSVLYGAGAALPEPEPVAGYTFTGWALPGQPAGAATAFAMPASRLALTGVWVKNIYAVSAEVDGAPFGAALQAEYGARRTAPAASAVPGFTFSGWSASYSGADGKTEALALTESGGYTMPAAPVVFSGTLTENSAVLRYTAEGGPEPAALSAQEESVSAATGAAAGVTLTLPDGWHVARWTSSNGATVQMGGSTFVPLPTDGLYADDTYTAHLAADTDTPYLVQCRFAPLSAGGAYEQSALLLPRTETGTAGQAPEQAILEALQTAKKSGEALTGFSYSKTTYASSGHAESETSLPVAGDGSLVITLYFTRNPHLLTFTAKGEPLAAPQKLLFGAPVNGTDLVPELDVGVLFTGWQATDRSARSLDASAGFVMPDADVIFEAQTEARSAAVVFHQGAHGTLRLQNRPAAEVLRDGLAAGAKAPLPPSVSADEGYRFTGWQPNDPATAAWGAYAAGAALPGGTLSYTAQYAPDTEQTFPATLCYRVDDGTREGAELAVRPAESDCAQGRCVGTQAVLAADDEALLAQYGVRRRDADALYSAIPFTYGSSALVNTVTLWYVPACSVVFDAGAQGQLSGPAASADRRTAVYTDRLATDPFPVPPAVTPLEGYVFLGWQRTVPAGDSTVLTGKESAPFPGHTPCGTTSYTAQYRALS